jgi:hypothetical protein
MLRPSFLFSHECHKSVKNAALAAAFYTTACVTADISAVTRVLARNNCSGIITEPQQTFL